MVDHIKYEPGAILISASMLGGFLPDDIDLGVVQHRLSYDELRNCWMRMQSFLAVNFKIRNMLTGVFAVFVIILFIMLLTDTVKTNPILGLFISFTIIMISLAMCINATQTKKKLQGLIDRENHEIWNSKGIYWKYAEYRAGHHQHGKGKNSTTVYLELRLSASAMDYNAPGQPFQGTLPNPYMQPQINYTPQVELRKYFNYSLYFNLFSPSELWTTKSTCLWPTTSISAHYRTTTATTTIPTYLWSTASTISRISCYKYLYRSSYLFLNQTKIAKKIA